MIIQPDKEKRLRQLKVEFGKDRLVEEDAPHNPLDLFDLWFSLALQNELQHANAMVLSTVGADHRPSSRVLLLKDYDQDGFVFYTNYESRKGKDLEQHPFAAMLFYWTALEKQVRIEGKIEKVSAAESDEYFASRPHESQLGALASPQSSVVESREALDAEFERLARTVSGPISRPAHWGGYRLKHDRIEFWQGRANRLHDRLRYTRRDDDWKRERLAP